MTYLEFIRSVVDDDPQPIQAALIAAGDAIRSRMSDEDREACRQKASSMITTALADGKFASYDEAYCKLVGFNFELLIGFSELAGDPDEVVGEAEGETEVPA